MLPTKGVFKWGGGGGGGGGVQGVQPPPPKFSDFFLIYIYFLKRKITENVVQNTPNCIIDKKYGEYAPIPLKIVCAAVIHYLLFLYKK